MTVEHSLFVCIPPDLVPTLSSLERQALAAVDRARKLAPGDRSEAIRFEQLHASIDQLAVLAISQGAPTVDMVEDRPEANADRQGTSILSRDGARRDDLPGRVNGWLEADFHVVELNLPNGSGPTACLGTPGSGPPPVPQRWHSKTRTSKQAMQERFAFLLAQALDGGNPHEAAIRPSGITNSVLTEGLRSEASIQPGKQTRTSLSTTSTARAARPFPCAARR